MPIDLNLTIYAHPRPQIDLYKDNQLLKFNSVFEDLPSGDIFLHYRIDFTHINQTGLYEYRVRNSFGSITYSKHLNIEGQKPLIQPLINQTISIGEQFTLACYASGQPNLQLKWIDQTTKQILNTSLTSPILFTSTSNAQSNLYSCQAINLHGEDMKDVYITVQIPAKILSITTNQTVKVNQTIKVFCSAEGDHHLTLNMRIPGSKSSNLIEMKTDYRKNLSLTFDQIQMSDSGIYECHARNNYSEDRSKFVLLVQNIPDRIERIHKDHSNRISWNKPFDGNTKIIKYILRKKFKRDDAWSREIIITIDDSEKTSYSLENIYSKCTISITIEAVNGIGSSLPSESLVFQTNAQRN